MNNLPFDSKFVDVLDSKMHYFESGEGDPIIFLHGVPTSAYLWHDVLPKMSEYGRCIAVDLIGLGESGKPKIDYTIEDHLKYFEAFIEALNLKNVTLVLHAWGSVVGFAYAMKHSDNVKGLAFYESYVRPILDWSMMSLPMQELFMLINEEGSQEKLATTDYFVEKVLPRALLKNLPEEETAHYKQSLAANDHRKPLLQYLRELPTGSEPEYVTDIMKDYSEKLKHSSIPKLMIFGVPGYNTTMSTVMWAKENLPNLTIVDIGPVMHFAQESNPEEFTEALAKWHDEHVVVRVSK